MKRGKFALTLPTVRLEERKLLESIVSSQDLQNYKVLHECSVWSGAGSSNVCAFVTVYQHG